MAVVEEHRAQSRNSVLPLVGVVIFALLGALAGHVMTSFHLARDKEELRREIAVQRQKLEAPDINLGNAMRISDLSARFTNPKARIVAVVLDPNPHSQKCGVVAELGLPAGANHYKFVCGLRKGAEVGEELQLK